MKACLSCFWSSDRYVFSMMSHITFENETTLNLGDGEPRSLLELALAADTVKYRQSY